MSKGKKIGLVDALDEHLGHCARMLSGSKSLYGEQHRENIVFFNACIFNAKREQVWWGDVDLMRDAEALQSAADASEEEFYLTREQPYRWDGLKRKGIKAELKIRDPWRRNIFKVTPGGTRG